MKTKQVYRKTEHFLYRQWDRGVSDKLIDVIISNVKSEPQKKSLIIAGNTFMKKHGVKTKNNQNLVVVVKNRALITLYFVCDLFGFLKVSSKRFKIIIL